MTNQDLPIIDLIFFLWGHFFSTPQICRIRVRSLFPAGGRKCDPEDSGVPGACGPDCRRAADIENLSHWCENEAWKPESAARNAVSEKSTRRNAYDVAKHALEMLFFDSRECDTDVQLSHAAVMSNDEE